MPDQKTVVLDLPEAAFQKILSELDPDDGKTWSHARAAAERNLRENILAGGVMEHYFTPHQIIGMSPQIETMDDSFLISNAAGRVELHMSESAFQKLAQALNDNEKKCMIDAFTQAASVLAKKEQRHPLIAFFAASPNFGDATIATHKGARIYVNKRN